MWEIFYEDKNKTFNSPDEILDQIKSLHLEYQNKQPQFIDIVLDRKTFIKIGIGDKFNRSMIFYHPYDISKDCRISFNPDIDVEDERKTRIFAKDGVICALRERNIIDFDDAINEVEFFLNNKNISGKIKMHTW